MLEFYRSYVGGCCLFVLLSFRGFNLVGLGWGLNGFMCKNILGDLYY